MKAKKHFGQNFLIDKTVIDKISNAVFACEDDLIIEIGPGRGALTHELVKKSTKILAYEIDTDMLPYLNKIRTDKFKVIYQDILKSDLLNDLRTYNYNKLYLVGNLPYYITTPIIEYVTKSGIEFESFTIMIQKEVADRFTAKPKTKEFGYFTLYLRHFYDIEEIVQVKKEAFAPMPKVQSTVVRLNKKKNVKKYSDDYFNFLKECFKEKRKTLRNNLREYNTGILMKYLKDRGYSESSRAEELTEDVYIDLYKLLK